MRNRARLASETGSQPVFLYHFRAEGILRRPRCAAAADEALVLDADIRVERVINDAGGIIT